MVTTMIKRSDVIPASHWFSVCVGARSSTARVQRHCRPVLPSVSAARPSWTAAEPRPSSYSMSGVRRGVRVRRGAVGAGAADARDRGAGLWSILAWRVCRSDSLPAWSARRPATLRARHSLEGTHRLRQKVWGRHAVCEPPAGGGLAPVRDSTSHEKK